MSSLTTTSINTANGSTNLTVGTGNSSGPVLLVTAGTDVVIRANTSANVFIANSTAIRANAAVTIANSLTVTSNIAANVISGNVTFSGTPSFTNVNITTANVSSISLGTPSIATSGHTRLPNGLLLQWGTVSVNATTGSITFPTAFAANPYSVQVTSSSGASANAAGVTAVSTTTATVRSASTAAASTAYWLAIGV